MYRGDCVKNGVKFLYGPAKIFLKASFIKNMERKKLESIGIKDEKKLQEYILKKYSTILLVAIILVIVVGVTFLTADRGKKIITKLSRNDYFGGDKEYQVNVSGENFDETISVNISNQVMSEEQIFEHFDQLFEELKLVILGKNKSLLEVNSDLNLVNSMENGAVKVKWNISDYSLISGNGKVNSELVENDGEYVCLVATLSYEKYYIDYSIDVKVIPPVYTEKENILNELNLLLINADSSNITQKEVNLPESVNGLALTYYEKKDDDTVSIIILSVIILIIVYLSFESKISKLSKERVTSLRLDYPEIVSKLTLLIGAGMTTRMAWEKIIMDYKQNRVKKKPAYEEMIVTYNHLQAGVAEGIAYAEYGKRCKLHEYVKLGMLLEQNIKKGTNDLKESLKREVENAFEDRKNLAKKLGEEAGTKLLLPIVLMLLVVLVIIMVPALSMIEF